MPTNKKFDTIFEDCMACGKKDMRLTTENVLEGGEIFHFDMCLDCDDKAGRYLTNREAHQTLIRLVDMYDLGVYGIR